MTDTSPPQPPPTTTAAQRVAILARLRPLFAHLAPLTDNDEAFVKHTGYGMLAALWGLWPLAHAADYQYPELPRALRDSSDAARDTYDEQVLEPAVRRTWDAVRDVISRWGARGVAEALVSDVNENPDPGDFSWYACDRFEHALEDYGPHPGGFVIVQVPGDDRVPYIRRPIRYAVCGADDPYVDWAVTEFRRQLEEWRAAH